MSLIKKLLGLQAYVSPLDEFLDQFNRANPKQSLSQRKEIEKYQRINALRDYPQLPPLETDFWQHF